MKKILNRRNLLLFIFVSLVVSAIFTTVRIVMAPTIAPVGDDSIRVKSDYVLMLLQCIVGVLAMLLPSLITKRIQIEIPSHMIVVYAIFLYCAIYLGEVRSFYYRIPYWDTILHTFSGAMLGALGYSLVSLLNNTDKIPLNLSPLFVAIFGFCFALSLGVVWEVYEFVADIILGTNMQKFALESGELLVGQEALADTMKDLIVDGLGALVMSVIGYLSLKFKTNWIDSLLLKRKTA